MSKYFIGFFVGVFFSGSLFQFDIGLPSYISKSYKQLSTKHTQLENKQNKIIKKQKNIIKHRPKKVLKRIAKQTVMSAVPIVGVLAVSGFAIDNYCEDRKEDMEMLKLIDDDTTDNIEFTFEKCVKDTKDKGITISTQASEEISLLVDGLVNNSSDWANGTISAVNNYYEESYDSTKDWFSDKYDNLNIWWSSED